jgi:hypothetical protein
VNLDFYGGFMGFGGIENDKRISAYRELFRRQSRCRRSFVLLLTIGFRESRGQEYDLKLHHIKDELNALGLDASDAINWYLSRPTRHKIKIYVPYLIDGIATANRFELKKHICTYYRGTSSVPMMHFAFDFEFSKTLVSPRRIGLRSLLDCPLFIVYPDRIEPSPSRPPSIIRRES